MVWTVSCGANMELALSSHRKKPWFKKKKNNWIKIYELAAEA